MPVAGTLSRKISCRCDDTFTDLEAHSSFAHLKTVSTEKRSPNMGVNKKTRKFAQVKRIIGQRDARLKKNQDTGKDAEKKKPDDDLIREA